MSFCYLEYLCTWIGIQDSSESRKGRETSLLISPTFTRVSNVNLVTLADHHSSIIICSSSYIIGFSQIPLPYTVIRQSRQCFVAANEHCDTYTTLINQSYNYARQTSIYVPWLLYVVLDLVLRSKQEKGADITGAVRAGRGRQKKKKKSKKERSNFRLYTH